MLLLQFNEFLEKYELGKFGANKSKQIGNFELIYSKKFLEKEKIILNYKGNDLFHFQNLNNNIYCYYKKEDMYTVENGLDVENFSRSELELLEDLDLHVILILTKKYNNKEDIIIDKIDKELFIISFLTNENGHVNLANYNINQNFEENNPGLILTEPKKAILVIDDFFNSLDKEVKNNNSNVVSNLEINDKTLLKVWNDIYEVYNMNY